MATWRRWGRAERAAAIRRGEVVACARRKLKLTQSMLAARLGFPQTRVAELEIGKSDLSAREICEAVGLDYGELYGG